MYLLIKEPVCDTVDDKRLTDFKTPLRLRAGGVNTKSLRNTKQLSALVYI